MKLVDCPDCEGHGSFEYEVTSFCGTYLKTKTEDCERCNGFGQLTPEEAHEKD